MTMREFRDLSDEELTTVLNENKLLKRWIANDFKKVLHYYGLEMDDERVDSKVLLHFKSILFVFEGKCWVGDDFKVCNWDGSAFNWGLLDIIQFI